MPGRPCKSGCDCKKHNRKSKLTPEEREQRHRDQSREGMQRRRERTPEGVREYERQYYATNRERINAQRAARYVVNPEPQKTRSRDYRRKNGFSITPGRFKQMLAEQEGRCYLCSDLLADERYKITVDHDHSCCPGQKACGACVRGLACRQCNTGLGMFGDDPERIRRAADALEAANARVRSRLQST